MKSELYIMSANDKELLLKQWRGEKCRMGGPQHVGLRRVGCNRNRGEAYHNIGLIVSPLTAGAFVNLNGMTSHSNEL